MTVADDRGMKMETEFSDPDDGPNSAEDDALLNQTSSPERLFSFDMADDESTDKSKRGDRSPNVKKSLGLASIGRYPKGVFFCLGNEFSERFSYYGMRAVLTLYLITVHDMDASNAKLLFHAFVSLAYFTPVLGSILADGFLGRYRVILYISICYCFGHLLLTMGAVAKIGSTLMKVMDFSGLFIIALSTGGIKPCVSAFAADQFPPNMLDERKQFFSFFYFSINLGALLSKLMTPILRRHHCLGEDHCFPLAFGVPAVVMFVATGIFWAGTRFYKIVPRTENVIVRVCRCVVYALRQRSANRKSKTEKHWLDYAKPKYDQALIDDIKTIQRIVVLFIPVIFFWSLFDQLGSTWVLQANAMNGRIGRLTLLPDQMPVLNPFLIIILVPVLEGVVYPILSKGNFLVKPLRRMGWGGLLAAISFAVAGLVQLRVDETRVVLPENGFGRFVLVSCLDNRMSITGGTKNFTIDPRDSSRYTIDAAGSIAIEHHDSPNNVVTSLPVQSGHGSFAVFFAAANPSIINYDLKKTSGGKTRLYSVIEDSISTPNNYRRSIIFNQNGKSKGEIFSNASSHIDLESELWGSNVYDILSKKCPSDTSSNLTCSQTFLRSYAAEIGSASVIILKSNGSLQIVELVSPNTVSMLWQVPQYLIITVGEALFSITGLEFSYSEASPSMKSVLTAIWLLTTAFGNVIDMVISGSGVMKNNPAGEFFVYASLMTVVMLAFIGLAWRYKSASETRIRLGSTAEANRNVDISKRHPSPKVLE